MKMNSIIALVVVAVFALVVVGSYVSNFNYGNEAERTIVAEHKNLQSVLGQYSLKIKEAAQIPTMQTEDLAKIFTNSLESRYGADGSQAGMQWIKEQNPTLDQSTYLKIQHMIEAGRNKFENHQSKFLDTKRIYETNLGYLWKGMWLNVAGYPKITLADYDIVISGHAQKSFETGIDEGLDLR
jgi:hypothetical protein